MKKIITAIALAALTLTLAGCPGGGSTADCTESAFTKGGGGGGSKGGSSGSKSKPGGKPAKVHGVDFDDDSEDC